MNLILRTLAIATTLALAIPVLAQTTFHDTVVSYTFPEPREVGHGDYWFAIPANYDDGGTQGKYIRIYISSRNNTTAFVQIGQTVKVIQVPSFGVATYDVPDTLEMESSGIVENKSIHVFDATDEISVYFMSHVPYSSDGTYIIPNTEWGRDYVVAGFASLLVCGITTYGDIPCSFTITADQDNTRIEITPSCDLRHALVYPLNGDMIAFPKGKKFSVLLNRGQSIQLESVDGETVESYDITGTIIHSNNPIGVIGASECTNIPSCSEYCDFVCHSILPISSWDNTYYSAPFVQTNVPPMPTHDSSMFLIVSSKDSQTIHRFDCDSGDHIECTIDTALQIRWIEKANASKWYSDAPFQLVQYINSATYPDGNKGTGDPAEVALEPKENFSNTCLFIVADNISPQAPYDNYANIFYNTNAAKSTMLDTESILKYTSTCIGDSISVAVIPHIKPGAHWVKSDSGVSIYVYGYGYDESYAWSGGLSSRPFVPYTQNDSIAPAISFAQNGDCIHTVIADTGSGLADIILDSELNMNFAVDSTFVPETGASLSFADLCDGGISQFAYAQFSVYDLLGNVSIATVTAAPDNIVSQSGFTLAAQSFDTTLVGTTKTRAILTITDTSSQYSTEIDSIWTDSASFVYLDTITGNVLPHTITPGASYNFSITFAPVQAGTFVSHVYARNNGLPVRIATLTGFAYSAASVQAQSQSKVSSPAIRATITPNPAENSLNLYFSLPQTADVTFEISSIDGTNVFEWNGNNESEGEHIKTIDVSSLMPGSYLYRFESNGQAISGKLIINS